MYLGGAGRRTLWPPYQGECKLVDREWSAVRAIDDSTTGAPLSIRSLNDIFVACPVLWNRLSPYNSIIVLLDTSENGRWCLMRLWRGDALLDMTLFSGPDCMYRPHMHYLSSIFLLCPAPYQRQSVHTVSRRNKWENATEGCGHMPLGRGMDEVTFMSMII